MRHVILIVLPFLTVGCGFSSRRPQLPPAPPIPSHTARSPSGTRDGVTITLKPSGFRFDVPQDWVDWHDKFGNNFHLTAEELDRVGHGAGEWDDEYARICNSIFPFDRCAAHVGEEGWGKEGVGYDDLQVRVYDLESPPKTIEENIAQLSTAELGRLINGTVKVRKGVEQGWRQTVLSYGRFYYDYGATASVDIRLKQIENRTIAFVFMHLDDEWKNKAIADMLRSFDRGSSDR